MAQRPDGPPVTLWKGVKTNLDMNGELDGRLPDLICRIDVEPDGAGPALGTANKDQAPRLATRLGVL